MFLRTKRILNSDANEHQIYTEYRLSTLIRIDFFFHYLFLPIVFVHFPYLRKFFHYFIKLFVHFFFSFSIPFLGPCRGALLASSKKKNFDNNYNVSKIKQVFGLFSPAFGFPFLFLSCSYTFSILLLSMFFPSLSCFSLFVFVISIIIFILFHWFPFSFFGFGSFFLLPSILFILVLFFYLHFSKFSFCFPIFHFFFHFPRLSIFSVIRNFRCSFHSTSMFLSLFAFWPLLECPSCGLPKSNLPQHKSAKFGSHSSSPSNISNFCMCQHFIIFRCLFTYLSHSLFLLVSFISL